jgi:predicted MFS family arabinose efflux permease
VRIESTPLRYLTWINLFPSFLLMGIFTSIYPIFLRSNFDLPESRVGLVILIRALITLIVFYIMGRMSRWHFNKKMILLAGPLMALLLVLFTGAHTLWHYALWTILTGIIIGYAYTNSMFHCLSGAVERQRRMNIHEIVLTAAMLTGSLIGGVILDKLGMNMVIAFVAAVMGLSFLLQLLVSSKINIKG